VATALGVCEGSHTTCCCGVNARSLAPRCSGLFIPQEHLQKPDN
jgi:hypothetical protein